MQGNVRMVRQSLRVKNYDSLFNLIFFEYPNCNNYATELFGSCVVRPGSIPFPFREAV